MMLYPPVAELAKKVGSRYLLVNLVARRARAISEEYEANEEPLDDKAVTMAIDEVYAGKLKITHRAHTVGEKDDDETADSAAEAETAESGESAQ